MVFFLNIVFFLFSLVTFSQVKIGGVVLNEKDQPITGASVYCVESLKTTLTDVNGKFYIETDTNELEVVIEANGYETEVIYPDKAISLENKVVLKNINQLSELVIVTKPTKRLKKSNNPAYVLLKKIWANKHRVGTSNFDYYQYKKQSVLKLGANEIKAKEVDILLANSEEKTTTLNETSDNSYEIPLFFINKTEEVYGKTKGSDHEISLVTQNRENGIMEYGVTLDQLMQALKPFDAYDNNITIANKPFTGPLSSFGYNAYLYTLTDTIVQENKKYYRVHFFPRTDEDFALQGDFIVRDSLFVLQSIRMYESPKTNLNFIKNFYFEKEYNLIDNEYAVLSKDHYLTNYGLKSDSIKTAGVFIHHKLDYTDYVVNKIKPDDFYENKKENKINRERNEQKTNIIITKDEKKANHIINSIKKNDNLMLAIKAADIMGSGFIPMGGCIDYGNIWKTVGYNESEGIRLRAGLRSFCSTSDRFRTYAYAAYGFRDKKIKYGLSAQYLLNNKPRIVLGASQVKDNEILSSGLDVADVSQLRMYNPYLTALRRGKNNHIVSRKKSTAILDFAPHKNLHFGLSAIHNEIVSALPDLFDIGYLHNNLKVNKINDFNIDLTVVYTPSRKVFDNGGVEQVFGTNIHPRYSLSLSKSVPNVINSITDYYKIQTSLGYPMPLLNWGLLDMHINAGKTFGKVPLVLTPSIAVNQSYSYIPHTFSLLNSYDFVTDTYANLFLEHHFNGFVCNKIPFTRNNKLQLITFVNFAYGSISNENKKHNKSSVVYNAPSDKIYCEYGFGFENIGILNVRPVRIDLIFRNQFKDVNGSSSPTWGVRFSVTPSGF